MVLLYDMCTELKGCYINEDEESLEFYKILKILSKAISFLYLPQGLVNVNAYKNNVCMLYRGFYMSVHVY